MRDETPGRPVPPRSGCTSGCRAMVVPPAPARRLFAAATLDPVVRARALCVARRIVPPSAAVGVLAVDRQRNTVGAAR